MFYSDLMGISTAWYPRVMTIIAILLKLGKEGNERDSSCLNAFRTAGEKPQYLQWEKKKRKEKLLGNLHVFFSFKGD